MKASLELAIKLAVKIHAIAPHYGAHVALTGGCLYKGGERKDIDFIIYRIRQVEKIDYEGLFAALESIGFDKPEGFGWIFKTKYNGVPIDLLFPEEEGGDYNAEPEVPSWVR